LDLSLKKEIESYRMKVEKEAGRGALGGGRLKG